MENTMKHPGGRPRKYAEGPGRYSITLSPKDKELVEKFLLWVQFHLGKRMGVAEVLLEGVRGSPLYAEFVRVTGYVEGGPAEPKPVSLPLFTEPEPERIPSEVTLPQEPVTAAPVALKPEALPVPVVTLQAPPVEPVIAQEPEAVKAPSNAEGVPDEAAVLVLVKAARDTGGKGVKAIALGAGVDLTMLYKALKGDRHLTSEARKKLFEYLKG